MAVNAQKHREKKTKCCWQRTNPWLARWGKRQCSSPSLCSYCQRIYGTAWHWKNSMDSQFSWLRSNRAQLGRTGSCKNNPPPPRDRQLLILNVEWHTLPQERIRTLIRPMRRRCEACYTLEEVTRDIEIRANLQNEFLIICFLKYTL